MKKLKIKWYSKLTVWIFLLLLYCIVYNKKAINNFFIEKKTKEKFSC